ncbi:MAG TPA: peptide chain release factor 1 [Oscillospiraceae bacterium]|nr:peptide chain release factor 1 [Oscillospiraceae bacterium]
MELDLENNNITASEQRYEELNSLIMDPEVMRDQDLYRKYTQEHSNLLPLVNNMRRLREVEAALKENTLLLYESEESDFRDLVREEISELEAEKKQLDRDILLAIQPKDPNDEKNVIVEIRAGAGGDEAGLFAAELFRMYTSYAENRNWTTEIIDTNETGIGGFKEIVFMIEGRGAFSRLKYESGVHRVQRVPVTESGGRIHTSTVTVAVLPEAEDVDVDIDPGDLQIDTYRASGAGGQHVNKTSSAIRITHLPTGVVVTCQDQRSQHKNREKAMRHLRSILLDQKQSEQASAIASERRSQVGTGDRSERIRTYNYPQGRVTDHRIGLTLYQLEAILLGDLDEIIEALVTAEHEAAMQEA